MSPPRFREAAVNFPLPPPSSPCSLSPEHLLNISFQLPSTPIRIPASLCALKFDNNSFRQLHQLLSDIHLSEYSGEWLNSLWALNWNKCQDIFWSLFPMQIYFWIMKWTWLCFPLWKTMIWNRLESALCASASSCCRPLEVLFRILFCPLIQLCCNLDPFFTAISELRGQPVACTKVEEPFSLYQHF